MEIGTQHIVDKLLLLSSFLGAACLILEDHVVVPSTLHRKVAGIEQWVAGCNVDFALFSFLGCTLRFL